MHEQKNNIWGGYWYKTGMQLGHLFRKKHPKYIHIINNYSM